MRVLFKSKDGGPESTVTGYWLIEWKRVFSIVLLKFEGKSREAFHNHAFNAWSWILPNGAGLTENLLDGSKIFLKPDSFVYTSKERIHKVDSNGTNWILSFRGPWDNSWHEVVNDENITLTHGRKRI